MTSKADEEIAEKIIKRCSPTCALCQSDIKRAAGIISEAFLIRESKSAAHQDTERVSLVQKVYIWLGYWRDKFPPESVTELQDLLGSPELIDAARCGLDEPVLESRWHHKASRQMEALRQAYRALDAIDRLVSDDWCEELEMRNAHKELTGDLAIAHKKVSLIYQIAHSESPNHFCYGHHADWLKTKDAILNPNQGSSVASKQKDGIALIAAERQRQVSQEGWTPEHDDTHTRGELANAASVYAATRSKRMEHQLLSKLWPFDVEWYRPVLNDRIYELQKAGALIAAEIDRLQRKASDPKGADSVVADGSSTGSGASSPDPAPDPVSVQERSESDSASRVSLPDRDFYQNP